MLAGVIEIDDLNVTKGSVATLRAQAQ